MNDVIDQSPSAYIRPHIREPITLSRRVNDEEWATLCCNLQACKPTNYPRPILHRNGFVKCPALIKINETLESGLNISDSIAEAATGIVLGKNLCNISNIWQNCCIRHTLETWKAKKKDHFRFRIKPFIKNFIRIPFRFCSNGVADWSNHRHVIRMIRRSCRAAGTQWPKPKRMFMPTRAKTAVYAECSCRVQKSNFESWSCMQSL